MIDSHMAERKNTDFNVSPCENTSNASTEYSQPDRNFSLNGEFNENNFVQESTHQNSHYSSPDIGMIKPESQSNKDNTHRFFNTTTAETITRMPSNLGSKDSPTSVVGAETVCCRIT